MERESSLGGGTEYTITGTPSVGSSARLIGHHPHGAPSYIDPPSFEETVIKARSRSHSAASAAYGMELEHTASMTGMDWDPEQGSKIDFPITGIPTDLADYIYDDSDNSIEKAPVSEDALSDHTEYSHLASLSTAGVPTTPTTAITTVSTSPNGQGSTSFFHHQLNLPTSASSTESKGAPISFGEMVHNRLSTQSEDEVNATLNYATYV